MIPLLSALLEEEKGEKDVSLTYWSPTLHQCCHAFTGGGGGGVGVERTFMLQ